MPSPAAALPCEAQLQALALCERRHPRERDLVCKALNAAAAWCLLKLRCPTEAADLEGCCGSSKKSTKQLQGPPVSVPRECKGAAAKLEACLERASEEGGGEEGK